LTNDICVYVNKYKDHYVQIDNHMYILCKEADLNTHQRFINVQILSAMSDITP
jgi:hypothetical protein